MFDSPGLQLTGDCGIIRPHFVRRSAAKMAEILGKSKLRAGFRQKTPKKAGKFAVDG